MPLDPETKCEVWLALRADGALGQGTAANPYDASSPTLFGDRMFSFQEKTTIHLGPGIFQVPAITSVNGAWKPKSGQRIIGAGTFLTTLKVVGASGSAALHFAIDSEGEFLDGFEVSDLTVDCNMRAHVGQGVAIGAIFAVGRRVRVRRVRAIDFGTENLLEGFVVGVGGAHVSIPEVSDGVIEDCLAERPSPNSRYVNTCFFIASGEGEGQRAFHHSCTIRRCLVNHEYANRPVAIASISYSGLTATALTKTPHGRSTSEWAVMSGALVEDPAALLPAHYNPFNGSYRITVLDQRRFQFIMPTAPAAEPTGEMWLGKVSSQFIGIKANPNATDPYNPGAQGVSVTATGSGQWEVTLITEKPHWKVPGNNVFVTNVWEGGVPSPVLNGLFRVVDVQNPTKLKFVVSDARPGGPSPDQVQLGNPYVGSWSNGLSVDGGVGALSENNRVFDARFGLYHDTFDSKDLVIRREYYSGAVVGIYQYLGGGTIRYSYSLTHAGTTAIFTTKLQDGTTPFRHTLEAGQGIIVSGASEAYYNGGFVIKSVPTPTTLTYEMDGSPSGPSTGAPQLLSIWEVGRLLAYRNLIDLRDVRQVSMTYDGAPIGVWMVGNVAVPPYTFRQTVLRDNIVRKAGGVGSQNLDAEIPGISVWSCENALAIGNVMDLTKANPVSQYRCGDVSHWGNQYQTGLPAQGYLFYTIDPPAGQFLAELSSDAALVVLGAI
jgi:hypothetical protein